MLRREQRNEVVVELGKGLEMGQYEISKYIPQYLGEAALYLHPSELDEQVLWLKSLLGSPNDSAVAGALNTIAVLLQHYPAYKERFSEKPQTYEHRRRELLGLLLQRLRDADWKAADTAGRWLEQSEALLRDPSRRPETFDDLKSLQREIRRICSRTELRCPWRAAPADK